MVANILEKRFWRAGKSSQSTIVYI